MPSQAYDWTCSVCSVTWVLQSTKQIDPARDAYDARYEVGLSMGYPNCVNETYGCMSSDCVIRVFANYGLNSQQAWVSFDQAYAIAESKTGAINPQGMYHYMAIRGVSGDKISVANSARGYKGVYDTLTREQFNNLGPVQVIAIIPS